MNTVDKRDELRTVSYWLDVPMGHFDPDNTSANDMELEETDEGTKEKEGLFHVWAEVLEWNAQAGQHYVTRVALIEDTQTGCLHEVPYKNFRFTDVCPSAQ